MQEGQERESQRGIPTVQRHPSPYISEKPLRGVGLVFQVRSAERAVLISRVSGCSWGGRCAGGAHRPLHGMHSALSSQEEVRDRSVQVVDEMRQPSSVNMLTWASRSQCGGFDDPLVLQSTSCLKLSRFSQRASHILHDMERAACFQIQMYNSVNSGLIKSLCVAMGIMVVHLWGHQTVRLCRIEPCVALMNTNKSN